MIQNLNESETYNVTIAFKSFPLGFSLKERTLPSLLIFIRPKSEARLS